MTSAMSLVKELLREPPDYYGAPALMNIHAAEGTACHAVCLDWLAATHGWLPRHTTPPWPEDHGDERRWKNVLHAALLGFQQFVELYDVMPLGIELESFSAAYGFVGHVDLYAMMNRKGRRVKAVIDLKFVAALQESHRLQLRCYGKLDRCKDASIGILYQGNRNTGVWRVEEVNLTEKLEDVAAVSNASRLFQWAENKQRFAT